MDATKKNVIVGVTNKNYLQHYFSLFGNLKRVGNYNGEFALILSEEIDQSSYDKLIKNNITIFRCYDKPIDPFYAKFYIFSEFMTRWNKICYFDADFVILKDINSLFEQYGLFLADIEEFPIHRYFSDRNPEKLKDLWNWFDLNKLGYNTGFMLFDNAMITEDTFDVLMCLKEEYQSINQHTGLENGTEQPIINIHFYNSISQVKNIDFVGRMKETSIAVHTTRWMASWNNNRPYYEAGLNYFNERF